MNTTIDFNVLSVFCRFRSHSLRNLFTHSTSYYSEFTRVFVTDSQYHECTGVGFASEVADQSGPERFSVTTFRFSNLDGLDQCPY